MALAELVARIKIISQSEKLQQLQSKLVQLEGKLKKLQGQLKQGMNVGKVNTASLDQASQKMKGLVNTAKSTAAGILSAFAVLGGVALLAGLGKAIFDTNVQFIKMKAALKTAAGGAKEADAAFKLLKNFAATTPFEMGEVVDSFIKLKNLGLTPSERALKSYGNTSTALGKSLNSMIEAVADASVGEFERLKEFGIKAKSQGDQVEFTFKGVKTTVKKNAKDIENYLIKLGEVNFGSAMADQMNTLPGIISNLKDNITSFLVAIGEGGLNDALANLLRPLRDAVGKSEGLGKNIGKALGDGLNFFISVAKQAIVQAKLFIISLGGFQGIKEKIDGVKNAFTLLVDKLGGAKGIITGLNAVLLILGLRMIGLKAIQLSIWAVSVVTSLYAMGAAAIFAQISMFLIPIAIGALIAALALLMIDIANFANGSDSMIGTAVAFWSDAFLGWKQIAIEVWESLSSLIQGVLSTIGSAVMTAVFAIVNFFINGWNMISAATMAVLAAIAGFISSLVSQAISLFMSLVNAIISGFQTAQAGVISALQSMASSASSVVQQIVSFFMNLPSQLIQIASAAARGFINALVNGIMSGVGAIGSAIQNVLASAKALLPHSDAKKGPLSNLTASGQSIPLTLAKGIMQRMDIPIALMENMAANMVATMPVIRPVGSSNSFNAGGVTNQTHITVNGQTGSTPLQLAFAARAGSSDGITDAFASVARNFPLRTANA